MKAIVEVRRAFLESKREVPRGVRNSKVRRQDKFRRDWSRHYTCDTPRMYLIYGLWEVLFFTCRADFTNMTDMLSD